jgi:hypothetical protein
VSESDVRRLLGKAVEGEPPLGIDRDEVFRAGRRKLRNRRFAEVGGVAAVVVAAVVGVAALIGGTGQNQVTPATSSGNTAAPPSTEPSYVTSEPPPDEDTGGHARTLTDVFMANNLLPNDVHVDPKSNRPEFPYFAKAMGTYHLNADIIGGGRSGVLYVQVSPVPVGTTVTCDEFLSSPTAQCTPSRVDGSDLILVKDSRSDGARTLSAYAVHQDGTKVQVYVSNERDGRTDGGLLLSENEVIRIATDPDLVWG